MTESIAAETTVVAREIPIDARPETVWRFLVEPEKMVRWMGIDATLEPVVGGAYRVAVIPGHTAAGSVLELEPERRLVVSWGWEPTPEGDPERIAPGASRVTFELEPSGTGTLLRFTHDRLLHADAAQSHSVGWDHYLPRLQLLAAGGDPGRDDWLDPPADAV